MQKKFAYFLIILQIFLILTYWIWYEALIAFLPGVFGNYQVLLQTVFTILVFAFPIVVITGYSRDNAFIRFLFKVVWAWMPIYWYGFLASVLCWLIYVVAAVLGTELNMAVIAGTSYSLALIAVLIGFINAHIHRVTDISVSLQNIPEYWKGKSVVLLTDLHVGHILRHKFIKRIVEIVNDLKPEAVFISGDYYDGVRTDIQGLADPLKEVQAKLGTYFVSGNHDTYRELDLHINALTKAGVKVIDGQLVILEGLHLIGEGYNHIESVESLNKFFTNLNLDNKVPSILLKHVPSNLKAAANAGISLILCGHTHYGQLWPFKYITYYVFRRYHYGLQRFGDMHVYTSSGVGTWGAPFRLGTKSEIVKITFK
jgi:uncharacterized protein